MTTCVISFLTNQLTVFLRAVKHLWFSVVWSFRSFCAGLFASRSYVLSLLIKWRQAEAGLLRSQMRNWSNSWKNKKIRIKRGKQRMSYSRISFRHQTLACFVQHLFISFHLKLWTTIFRNSSLPLEKKMTQTMDRQVWDVFFQASRDIRKNRTTASQFLLTLCLKLQWQLWEQNKRNLKPRDWEACIGHRIA